MAENGQRCPICESGIKYFRNAKRDFEAAYVERLLRVTHGNVSASARLAGKDRKDFYDLVRRTGVDVSDFRD